MEPAEVEEDDSSDEEARVHLMEVDQDQDREYLRLLSAYHLSPFWYSCATMLYWNYLQHLTSELSERRSLCIIIVGGPH